jgi:hypothetical protein
MIMQDRPLSFWIFRLIGLASGLAAIAASVFTDLWANRFAGSATGTALLAVCLVSFRRCPASVAILDNEEGELRVRRWGPGLSLETEVFPYEQIEDIVVERGTGRNSSRYRPVVKLKDGVKVPLTILWRKSETACRQFSGVMRDFFISKPKS